MNEQAKLCEPIEEQAKILKWRLFRDYGPWHLAYNQSECPPLIPHPTRGYKNWRARCGSEFTPGPVKEQDDRPGDSLCQRCLRGL